jgi:predicted nucleotidyltransferase
MRKRPIDTFLTPVQQDILAATYDTPEKWWYLSELATHAKRTVSSLQRDLRSFTDGGVLESRRDTGRVYYRAGLASPLFAPLKEIVERSLGIETQLLKAIEPMAAHLEAFFIYGSVAQGEEGPQSDVDLICVGDIGLADLSKVLRPLEKRFRREFNATTYAADEFIEKLTSGNHFLNALREQPKIFIVGSENVFGRRRGKRPHTTA